MSPTKERPILFNGPMVNALLAGRKTQTRRIMKPQPFFDGSGEQEYCVWKDDVAKVTGNPDWHKELAGPYGQVGDRLWVRETFGIGSRPCPFEGSRDGLEYRADEAFLDDVELLPLYSLPDDLDWDRWEGLILGGSGWRPSIHMPRWASRIDLEITNIRVERLQDITEADAKAEGVYKSYDIPIRDLNAGPYQTGFRRVWEQINGKDSWDANPWVWVVEFKHI